MGKSINSSYEWLFNIFGFVGGLIGAGISIWKFISWIKKNKINWKRILLVSLIVIASVAVFISSLLNIVSHFKSDSGNPAPSVTNSDYPHEPSVSELPEPVVADVANFEYVVENDCVAITKYNGTDVRDVSIIIPNEIDGKKVVKIKKKSFCDNLWLKYLVIPDGVEVLEDTAIWRCQELQRLDIPKSVLSIDRICESCPKLDEINIDDENPNYCFCDGLLLTKDKSTLIKCLDSTAGKSYKIPDYVKIIHNAAFANLQSVEEIEMSDSVTKMGWSVFHSCHNLKSIKLSENLYEIQGETFANCFSLESITIPKSVWKLGNRSFLRCSALKEVTFENKNTAFYKNPFEEIIGDLVLKGASGSSAEMFAKKNGLKFEPVG